MTSSKTNATPAPEPTPGVSSYTITGSNGTREVMVTGGLLRGKSAKVITTSPSGAYFNEKPNRREGS